jgi:hypothetical protein
LSALPFTTTLMAATADHSRLVLYDPTTRTLTSIDPGTIVASRAELDFAEGTDSQTVTVSNLTSAPVTLTAITDTPAFTVSSEPRSIPAGGSAVISVTHQTGIVGAGTLHLSTGENSAELSIPISLATPATEPRNP